MYEHDAIFKFMLGLVSTLATIGMIALLCLMGLGIWKVVELIS